MLSTGARLSELWRQFEIARPRLLGALLDAAVHGLQTLPGVRLTSLPRMADFAQWATACGMALWPAGTFARAYRQLVGEGAVSLTEFIRRASTLPAWVLGVATGGAARKGTLAVGADADVVVFAPDAFRDRATYEASTQTSTGVRHLLVSGAPVIRDSALLADARPGRPVRRG